MKKADLIILILEEGLNLGIFINLFSGDEISEERKTSINEWTVLTSDTFEETALFQLSAEPTWLFRSRAWVLHQDHWLPR
jgi:hypothetical protein